MNLELRKFLVMVKMSPFSKALKELRISRKLLQKEAAELLGYEASYLSALELSLKGPPKMSFVEKLILKFDLNDFEQSQLMEAYAQSERQYILPSNASIQEYRIFHLLKKQLGKLQPQQIDLINLVLRMDEMSNPMSALEGCKLITESEAPKM